MVGKSLLERLDGRGICRRPLHKNAGDGPDELDERSKYTLQFLLGKATPNVAAVVLRRRPGRLGSPGRQHALHFVSEPLAFRLIGDRQGEFGAKLLGRAVATRSHAQHHWHNRAEMNSELVF